MTPDRPNKRDTRPLRLFVAVLLPPNFRREVFEAGKRICHNRTNVSITKEENLHITLKFLGDVPVEAIGQVSEILQRVAEGESGFDVEVAGSGAFPSRRRPKVFWVGIGKGADRLRGLSRRVEKSLVRAGFADENRFKPHITVARTRGSGQPDVDDELALSGEATLGEFRVNDIFLMKSTLAKGGSIYEVVKQFRFAQADTAGGGGTQDG